jgi:hypothetical protein
MNLGHQSYRKGRGDKSCTEPRTVESWKQDKHQSGCSQLKGIMMVHNNVTLFVIPYGVKSQRPLFDVYLYNTHIKLYMICTFSVIIICF